LDDFLVGAWLFFFAMMQAILFHALPLKIVHTQYSSCKTNQSECVVAFFLFYCTTQQNEGNAPKRQKAKNGAHISEIKFSSRSPVLLLNRLI
jgi:hypothetical protein